LSNLVDYAIDQAIDFIVIAGDLYDGDWRDYATGLFFNKQMVRLGRHGIRVYVLHGNHDAESQITRQLAMPENTWVFPPKKPHTFHLEDHNVVLHGQSFATAAVSNNLARSYPESVRGTFNIGVLHTAAGGREGHANYAPCSLEDLLAKGYDYWALGHVHTKEVLHEYPHVVFPGNLQGRNIRETGAKGFAVVTVDEQRIAAVDHVAADVVRWSRAVVDTTGCIKLEEVVDRISRVFASELGKADDRLLIVRVVLQGRTDINGFLRDHPETLLAECRNAAIVVSEDLWVEKTEVQTNQVYDLEAASVRPDAVGTLLRSAGELLEDPAALAALETELGSLVAKMPEEVRRELFPDGQMASDLLASIIEEAKAVLTSRLSEGSNE
jgi:DNA repair exonuclease SbcCD nuclease subunit